MLLLDGALPRSPGPLVTDAVKDSPEVATAAAFLNEVLIKATGIFEVGTVLDAVIVWSTAVVVSVVFCKIEVAEVITVSVAGLVETVIVNVTPVVSM
jgi:hypothetical protein